MEVHLIKTNYQDTNHFVKNFFKFSTDLIKPINRGEYYFIVTKTKMFGIVAIQKLVSNKIFLDKLGILSDYKHQGIGTKVIKQLQNTYNGITLKCFNKDLELHFYNKLGFITKEYPHEQDGTQYAFMVWRRNDA